MREVQHSAKTPAQPIATIAAGPSQAAAAELEGEPRGGAAPPPAQPIATTAAAARQRKSDRSRYCCYRNIRKFDVSAWWNAKPASRRWIKRQSSKRMRRLGRRFGENAPTKPYKLRR